MKKEQILAMREKRELDAVVEEIRKAKDDPNADIAALNELLDAVEQRRKELQAMEAERRALADRIGNGETGTVVRTLNTQPEVRKYTDASPEYRTGFLKTMLDLDMTKEERDAVSYVATTGDSTYGAANLLPKTLLNQIWDMIDEQHSILGDITMYRTGTILEIAKRTGITQGDATTVNENAANDDEINTFAKVTLTGKDFSKHFNISYAMARMSIDAFESFLVNELADRIGAALAADVISQISSDYDSTYNAIATASAEKIAFTDVASALAVLKNANGQCVVYGSHATIYKYLVGMVDTTGRPIFQPNAQRGAEGTLVGCPVKVEDGISGNALLIGYPKNVVGNMIQDIMVESDKDITKHVITYAGYARFECKLLAPKAFAKLTVTASNP